MNRIIRLITVILPLICVVCSCSTMQTQTGIEGVSTLTENQPYQLRVRSGNSTMDKIIYEFALFEFGKYLPISEGDSYIGTIEIIFASTSESSFVGSTSAFTTGYGYGNAWYTGSGYIGLSGTTSTFGSSITSGSTFTWQNSTMLIAIKSSQERRLWMADYKYKGGWEMSGFSVNTADEAARLCIKRIVAKLTRDFPDIEKINGMAKRLEPEESKEGIKPLESPEKSTSREISFSDGSKYVGNIVNGMKNGQGTYTWPDGNKYVGEFKDDRACGGWLYKSDGSKSWCYQDAQGNWVKKEQ